MNSSVCLSWDANAQHHGVSSRPHSVIELRINRTAKGPAAAMQVQQCLYIFVQTLSSSSHMLVQASLFDPCDSHWSFCKTCVVRNSYCNMHSLGNLFPIQPWSSPDWLNTKSTYQLLLAGMRTCRHESCQLSMPVTRYGWWTGHYHPALVLVVLQHMQVTATTSSNKV